MTENQSFKKISSSSKGSFSGGSSPSSAIGVAPYFYEDIADIQAPRWGGAEPEKGRDPPKEFLLDNRQLEVLFNNEMGRGSRDKKNKKTTRKREKSRKGKGKRWDKSRKQAGIELGSQKWSDSLSETEFGDKKDLSSMIRIPSKDELMEANKELSGIAEELPQALKNLEIIRSIMEKRIEQTREKAILPFQVRRARLERRAIREEIRRTERAIKEVHLMTRQLENVLSLQETVKKNHMQDLQLEMEALKREKAIYEDAIREGTINRINLLRLYWPWRQLQELGDIHAAKTFAEELQRGPRFRNVNLQNNIQSDMAEHQLRWLENLVNREDIFRGHLSKLDNLVDDLTDVTELLESALTCAVCGLLFEDPVLFWPCGHTFCLVCFESLKISPNLYRCPSCSSLGSEGFLHNILVGDSVAKWMFKDSGYGDLKGPMINIRSHLLRFSRQNIHGRIKELRQAIHKRDLRKIKGVRPTEEITVSYRAY